MIGLFFPKGKSTVGNASNFDFNLGNFKGEAIHKLHISDYIK